MSLDVPMEYNGNEHSSSSNSAITTQFSQTKSTSTADLDAGPSLPIQTNFLFYEDSLLPNFDDLPEILFPRDIDITTFESNLDTNNSANTQSPVDNEIINDPVERLSKCQLELYQCFTSVKAVEKLKKEKLRNIENKVGEIDTTWLQHLFRTTELFISTLTGYFGNNLLTGVSKPMSTDTVSESREAVMPNAIVEVDTATCLMIVSCYMRFLQVFEVVVFVIETYRDFDCPGNYVEIRFGSFMPKADKALSARFLGQYVLHLLDGISGAVDKAISSRQPYARAIADTRRDEAKLKERILTAFH